MKIIEIKTEIHSNRSMMPFWSAAAMLTLAGSLTLLVNLHQLMVGTNTFCTILQILNVNRISLTNTCDYQTDSKNSSTYLKIMYIYMFL